MVRKVNISSCLIFQLCQIYIKVYELTISVVMICLWSNSKCSIKSVKLQNIFNDKITSCGCQANTVTADVLAVSADRASAGIILTEYPWV